MPKKRIAALILAAGRSSRMGTLKQLLPIQKTTLLEYVIKNVKLANVDKVYCVIGAKAETIEPYIKKQRVEIVFNPNYNDGLSSSIKCGIEQIRNEDFEASLIVLADQPLIKTNYFNTLISEYNGNQDKIIATDYAKNYGVPVVIPKSYFPDLLKLKGDKGAKEFLNSRPKTIVGLKTDTLMDIDTEKDYQELIHKIKKI